MGPATVNIITIGFIMVVLVLVSWRLRRELRKNPRATIVLTMAALIFIITVLAVVKTYRDYQNFLANIGSHEVIVSTIIVAVFLDFSVLMIGGLFLYLANQLYTSDFIATESEKQLPGSATKQKQPPLPGRGSKNKP